MKDPEISGDAFLSLLKERFACKLYDVKRQISEDDISYILECARLSPSSFGIEHWHFFAVSSPSKIAALRSACFDQDAVGTASLVVVTMCRKDPAYAPASDFIRERGSRFPGGLSVFVDDYRGYYEYLSNVDIVDQWARAQCYIPCANMMTGAKVIGIDSCAIEGYDNGKILGVLALDPLVWQTGIVTVFGYSAENGFREKIRESRGAVITRV